MADVVPVGEAKKPAMPSTYEQFKMLLNKNYLLIQNISLILIFYEKSEFKPLSYLFFE